ncbi:MAG: hypothetical protein U1F83_19675, partial [Verrucomicrobiota bacterium]
LPLQPKLVIDFQRTLRIPDDGKDYPLPPGFGSFPLRHIDDYARNVPVSWLQRGGVLLPMWQAEALWLNFQTHSIKNRSAQYPFAIKVATGKISAITGEAWQRGLSRNPQDYLVVPRQPWLDGYCVQKGVIRQFVAMPLGEGYTAEEQITGEAEFGGMQIEVFPMRAEVFETHFPVAVPDRLREMSSRDPTHKWCSLEHSQAALRCVDMGLAPGGRMRQEIYKDLFSIHDWDTEHSSRCFIHLVNSAMWHAITGQRPPTRPPTARQYTTAGYPWFDYYDAEAKALEGSSTLAKLKSVLKLGREKRESPLPENASVSVTNLVNLRADLKPNQVRESDFS